MFELLHQLDRSETLQDHGIIAIKETMMANVQQQAILSKMMRRSDSERFACIEKYFGKAFAYLIF